MNGNLGTILVGLILAAAVGAIVWRLVRNRRRGKPVCGCNCAACPMGGACHRMK